jgi:hypothetical protein
MDIDAYIATGKGETTEGRSPDESVYRIKKSQFAYDAERNCFVCPAGLTLELQNIAGDGKKIYQAQSDDCSVCSYRGKCCT